MRVKLADIPSLENDLLEYIKKETQHTEHRPPGFGVTSFEYGRSVGLPLTTARRTLQKMVRDGKLKVKHMIEESHIVTVYYK